ncbi:MAG: hypothetical protein C0176_06195, partial [Mesoaciditoga sp.]
LEAVVEVLSSEGLPAGIYPDRELTNSERAELKRIYLNHRHDRGSGKSEAINGMEFGIVEEISSKIKVSPLRVVEEIKKRSPGRGCQRCHIGTYSGYGYRDNA